MYSHKKDRWEQPSYNEHNYTFKRWFYLNHSQIGKQWSVRWVYPTYGSSCHNCVLYGMHYLNQCTMYKKITTIQKPMTSLLDRNNVVSNNNQKCKVTT